MPSVKSLITDIEHLSKTRNTYSNELSFAGRGLKLNTRKDGKYLYLYSTTWNLSSYFLIKNSHFDSAQDLKQAILNTPNLKVLRLEGNTIAPEAAEELAEALETQKLERFIGNDIFTGRLKDEIPLALVIYFFHFLLYLICFKCISCLLLKRSICGAIDKSGANLVEVNMSDNAFGPIGLFMFFVFVFKEYYNYYIVIYFEGLEALMNFFQSNCCFSLKEIRLHNNGLGPDGAKKLAVSLGQGF